ncbi:FAD binding domain-containing protein [Pseudonocardia lutea]|uniref:FAD binding domain-containing protein n=1 Tax=Pseudonocardia lutea TaxID=2172015 RepID=A0ABW1I1R8_9PSEU
MIRTRMRYHRPQTLVEASQVLLEHHGNVAVLGGGTFLLPRMNRHLMEFENVVDLQDLGLRHVTSVDGEIVMGAGVTYVDVLESDLTRSNLGLLPRMAEGVTGGRQITQQGTLVGAACFQFPTTDAPGALVALDGTVDIQGPDGRRSVPISDFLIDAFVVDLRPGEFVSAMRFAPQPAGGYCKVKHATGSWPIVTASAVPATGGGVRVTLGAVEARPVVLTVEDPFDRTELEHRVDRAITAPWSDHFAPGSYRADIAAAVARRAILDLTGALT